MEMSGLANYVNVPMNIGLVVSAKMATLHELETVYSMEDVYDMLEILYIDNENQRRIQRKTQNG